MKLAIRAAALVLFVSILATSRPVVGAGLQAGQAGVAPAASGKEILQRRCFQCHQASMWGALRQDRRSWESTLYRMVGRGALWTPEEITAMAAFLAETRGPVK
ncbi:MAG: hypothetical protein HY824_11285 [Acidobacteria bacterium]|nr:hypothetical protein [Acidobacteriota bacterium]